MKRLFATALMLASAVLIAPASADTVLDPLHSVVCAGPGGTGCVNTDNGNFSPTNQVNNLGFEISPPNNNPGLLTLAIFVPSNEIDVTSFNLPGLTDNGGAIGTSVFDRLNLLNAGNGSNIATYLALANATSYSPTNNFSNLTAGVGLADPGFNGNLLGFTATLPGITLDAQGSVNIANDFSFGANLPAGTVITAFFATTDSHGNPSFVSTAASEDLVVQPLAVPAPLVGAGLPGLIAGCAALWGLNWRRRKNLTAAV